MRKREFKTKEIIEIEGMNPIDITKEAGDVLLDLKEIQLELQKETMDISCVERKIHRSITSMQTVCAKLDSKGGI